MRVALPDRPGSLGLVASAIGAMKADIHAIEIIDRTDGLAVDDFILSLPSDVLPDTLITACSTLPNVEVLWLSYYPESWGLQADVDVLIRMTENPIEAERILLDSAPELFRANWAVLIDRTLPEVIFATELAPELQPEQVTMLGDLASPHIDDLPAGWIEGWGETIIAVAPFRSDSTLAVGRSGGPEFRPSELARMRHLASLAGE